MIHLLGNVKENGGFFISCGSISYFAEGSPVCFKVSLLFLLCHNLFWPVSTSFDFVIKNRLERWWLLWAVTPRRPPYPSLNTSGLQKLKKLFDDYSYQGLLHINPIHAGVFLVLLFKIHVAPRKNFIRWNFFEKS